MTAPLYPSIDRSPPEALMICFKIISRRSWDVLQGWREAFPGSRVEHVLEGTGIFVLHVPPGGAGACRVSIPLEEGRDLRTRAWRHIFACHARKQAGQPE